MSDSLHSFCKIFVDDSKIYKPVDPRSDQENLQIDLLKFSQWSKLLLELLEFFSPKCKLVQYSNVKYHFIYQMKNQDGILHNLPSDSKEKNIEIIFENTLNIDAHISFITERANELLWLIKRTFKSLNMKLFLTLY